LFGNLHGKGPLKTPGHRWDNNNIINYREIGFEGVNSAKQVVYQIALLLAYI
jgi:hypothetical protein